MRFSLANERTFLAWIRTGLALIACGVALEAFSKEIHPVFSLAASVLLILSGIAAPVQAWFGWMRSESSLRYARPLPSAPLALPLGLVVLVVGILIFIGLLIA